MDDSLSTSSATATGFSQGNSEIGQLRDEFRSEMDRANASSQADNARLREEQRADRGLLINLFSGVAVVLALTFALEIFSMHRNYAADKEIAIQNLEIQKEYTTHLLSFQERIAKLEVQILQLQPAGK